MKPQTIQWTPLLTILLAVTVLAMPASALSAVQPTTLTNSGGWCVETKTGELVCVPTHGPPDFWLERTDNSFLSPQPVTWVNGDTKVGDAVLYRIVLDDGTVITTAGVKGDGQCNDIWYAWLGAETCEISLLLPVVVPVDTDVLFDVCLFDAWANFDVTGDGRADYKVPYKDARIC